MILVFDLDDTLYDERTYVLSSFQSVASYLAEKIPDSVDNIYKQIIEVFEKDGRGKVFDKVLRFYNYYSKNEVKNCLSVYRRNDPDIKLFVEAENCLKRFHNYPKYLVTDGNKNVQKIKIRALQLNKYFIKTIPTHSYRVVYAKPSTYIFHQILSWEKKLPQDLIYIGDNPNKDFINLKKEGFNTIRVLTGAFGNVKFNEEFDADYSINTLDELSFDLINIIKSKHENCRF